MVESAVTADSTGGGEVLFDAGMFDLGSTNLEFYDVFDITFAGQGMGVTTLRNVSSAAKDTEPFDFTGALRVTIRDMRSRQVVRHVPQATPSTSTPGTTPSSRRSRSPRPVHAGIVFDGKGGGRTPTATWCAIA